MPSEHFLWLVLQRVNTSRITVLAGRYFDRGAPAGMLVVDVLDTLMCDGLVDKAAPSPDDGLARLSLTTTARYSALCRAQRARPQPPAHDHG